MDAKSRARLEKISDQRRSETVRTVRNKKAGVLLKNHDF